MIKQIVVFLEITNKSMNKRLITKSRMSSGTSL